MNEKKRSGIGLLLLAFAALTACATGPAPVSAPMPRSVLLAPTGVEGRLAGLKDGVPTVHKLIGQVLFEQDVQVGTVSSEELAAIWEIASRGLTAESVSRDPEHARDMAVDAVVDALRARGSRFDALLVPYLVVRNGSINGTSVWWDGVRRQVPVDAAHRHDVLMPMRRGMRTPCISLRVVAYDAHGSRLFERTGGLEVANRLTIANSGSYGSWSARDDLFQDPEALRRGVQVALRPFLRN